MLLDFARERAQGTRTVTLEGQVLRTNDERFHLANPGRVMDLQCGPFGAMLVLSNQSERMVLTASYVELKGLVDVLKRFERVQHEPQAVRRLRRIADV